jgi:hypothetical protein
MARQRSECEATVLTGTTSHGTVLDRCNHVDPRGTCLDALEATPIVVVLPT